MNPDIIIRKSDESRRKVRLTIRLPGRGNLPGPDIVRIDRLKFFLDSMGGGAWPFLVGGVICLVNSVNERDLDLLNSGA